MQYHSKETFSYGFGADFAAASYFDSLPAAVKREINEHPEKIHSIEQLRRYAQQLMVEMSQEISGEDF